MIKTNSTLVGGQGGKAAWAGSVDGAVAWTNSWALVSIGDGQLQLDRAKHEKKMR